MNRYSTERYLIRLVVIGLLAAIGQVMAQEDDFMEMQGHVNLIHAEWNSLIIDDIEYQVPPNVGVNGLTSPRAYLFGRLTVGDVVTLVAQRQDGGLRLLEIRIER
jgi:hypothetical protein